MEEIKKYDFDGVVSIRFDIENLEDFYNTHQEQMMKPHRTEFYQIFWFGTGGVTIKLDFNAIDIVPDTILFIPKDTVQQLPIQGNFKCKIIAFSNSFFCKSDSDTKFLQRVSLFNNLATYSVIHLTNNRDQFAGLLAQMEAEKQNENDTYKSEILKSLLHSFLLLSERELQKENLPATKRSVDYDFILCFKNLLESNYLKHKQVSFYARESSITERRLHQATKRIFGRSPKNIIDERILLEAKRLLAHTNDSIKEIGFYLGFEETTNFIKYFRKHSSCTPAEFRANLS